MNTTFAGARTVITGGASNSAQSFDIGAFVARYGGTMRCIYKAGERLFVQDEAAHRLFYIQQGKVQITVVSARGKEAILSILGAGDFCGEGCVIAERTEIGTATCVTDCVIAGLERTNVVRAIRQDAGFAEFFIGCVLRQALELRERLLSHLFDTSELRLARVLLRLASYGKHGRQGTIMKTIDQETLAQMVGTTRSRVNYFMNRFRKLGYIDYNSASIVVHPSLADAILRDAAFALPEHEAPAMAYGK
jgi:CRP/FNR family transcriptional regulator, cyclic AMP receptor protein